jgi:AraC family ethanolamine operon transcriptional activator
MTTEVFSLESRDFTEMEATIGGWDHQYQQVGPGDFCGSLLFTQKDSLQILRNRWERAIHYRGAVPKETVGLALTMTQSGQAYWMGAPVAFDDVILQRAGVEADYISGSLWDSIVLAIPEAELAQHIAIITQDDPENILTGQNVVRLDPQKAAQLRHYFTVYLRAVKQCLAKPGAATDLPEMATLPVELLAQALAESRALPTEKCSPARQRHVIRTIEAFDQQNKGLPLRIGRLSQITGLSSRTLQRIFNDQTGMSPLYYLKYHRLNGVRRKLRETHRDSALVNQIAYQFGFNHLSQFSRDYKQLFGELPSHTLTRSTAIEKS